MCLNASVDIVAKNSTLQTLDLRWNHIRRDSAVHLCKALGVSKYLGLFIYEIRH